MGKKSVLLYHTLCCEIS